MVVDQPCRLHECINDCRAAKFETRLVSDGAMLVKAEYHVQQDGVLNWTVNVPSLEQILTCEVNGKGVKPIR